MTSYGGGDEEGLRFDVGFLEGRDRPFITISQNTENTWALGEFKGLTGLASTVGMKFLLRVFISVI